MPKSDKRDLSQKRVVDAIRPGATRFKVWDTKLRGFGLDVRPPDGTGTGGGRTWILNYRFQGQQRRMALGSADVMTPDQARKAALGAYAQLHEGIDPLARKRGAAQARRSANATVEEIAERYLATLKSRGSSSTWATEARRIYETKISPALGEVPARDVAVKDARALHESLATTPVAANRTKAVLSAILTRAIEDGDRPRELLNPAAAVPDYPETERDRYLTEDEWPRVAKALQQLRGEFSDLPAWDTRGRQLDALVTLALTGGRLRAVLPRRWPDVDWPEHALDVTPAHKGVSRILLGAAAEAHLRAIFDRRGNSAGYIFPGQERRVGVRTARYERDTRPQRPPSPISSLSPAWARLSELAALEDFTLHDWRRTFATVAGDVGISDHMIGGLLGHSVPGIRRRYARRTDEALLEAANKVSTEIANRLALPLTSRTKVVPITATRTIGAQA